MAPPEMDEDDSPEMPTEQPPQKHTEAQVAPPKPELQIVDYSEKKFSQYCVVCGQKKDRYLEVEVR